jgi:hypothetical protein
MRKVSLLLIDEFSRFTWMLAFSQKFDVLKCFKLIKKIQSDAGGEFMSNQFLELLKLQGITN